MAKTLMFGARSGCPIATTLDVVGDRWSLIILRDMINGKKRFSDFLRSPEKITTSVLTDRLDQLERAGIVIKAPYQSRPTRYEYSVTPMGLGLLPVLQEISRWANRFIPGTWIAPAHFMERRVD